MAALSAKVKLICSCSEGLDHNKDHDRDHDNKRKLVQKLQCRHGHLGITRIDFSTETDQKTMKPRQTYNQNQLGVQPG